MPFGLNFRKSVNKRTDNMFGGDHLYFAVTPAYLIGGLIILMGLTLIAVDNFTSHFGVYDWFLRITSHAHDATYTQYASYFSWLIAFTCTLFEFIMFFQMGNHYRTRLAQTEDTAHGIDRSHNEPLGWNLTFFIFHELQSWFPLSVAVVSIGTTTFGLYQWEAPVATMSTEAIAGDLVIALVVFFCGVIFFLRGWHMIDYGRRESRLAKRIVKISPAYNDVNVQGITTKHPVQQLLGGGNSRREVTASPEANAMEELQNNPRHAPSSTTKSGR